MVQQSGFYILFPDPRSACLRRFSAEAIPQIFGLTKNPTPEAISRCVGKKGCFDLAMFDESNYFNYTTWKVDSAHLPCIGLLGGGFNPFEKHESNCIIFPGRDEH